MELFLPSLFIFLLAVAVVVVVLPRFSPLIITILATVLLVFGIYHHFHIFWNEYRTATWADQLKLFAPGIMLACILVYIAFSVALFFTGGSVPVPSIPNIQLPSANTATNMVTGALNTALQTVVPEQLLNTTNQQAQQQQQQPQPLPEAAVAPPKANNTITERINNVAAKANNAVKNLSKSFLAAI